MNAGTSLSVDWIWVDFFAEAIVFWSSCKFSFSDTTLYSYPYLAASS